MLDGSLAVCDTARRGRLVNSNEGGWDEGLTHFQEGVDPGGNVGDDRSVWTSADDFVPANRIKKQKVRLLTMYQQQYR